MTQSLVDKFKPENLNAVQGHNKKLKQIKQWAENWSGDGTPFLFSGPPGIGKTSVAHALAKEMEWSIVEINASSNRRAEDIDEVAAAIQRGGDEYQLVFLDEIDGFQKGTRFGRLKEALTHPANPVVATANDAYSVPRSIKGKFNELEFKLGKRSKRAKIRKVAEAEGIEISDEDLETLASRSGLRDAISDLQTYAAGGSIGQNDRTDFPGEFDSISNILKGSKEVDPGMNPEDLLWWLDQNWREDESALGKGVKDIRGIEIPLAYRALSQADICLKRARTDYWYWDYAKRFELLTSEVRRTEPWSPPGKEPWISVDYPQWFRAKEKSMSSGGSTTELYELAQKNGIHSNYTNFRKSDLPLLKQQSLEDRMLLAHDWGVTHEDKGLLGELDISVKDYKDFKEGESGEEEVQTELPFK